MTFTEITRDTKLFLSLARFPGNSGTTLFNQLFRSFGLDCVYKACAVEPGQLSEAVSGMRALGIAGGGISMPFKETILPLLDEVDRKAGEIGAVNTVVRLKNGRLKGYNTDYTAARQYLDTDSRMPTLVLGAGGAARAVCYALKDAGYRDVLVLSRSVSRAAALAEKTGFLSGSWKALEDCGKYAQWVHATPLGMPGAGELEIPEAAWAAVRRILDLPMNPEKTALMRQAEARSIPAVSGYDFARRQAVEQFRLYTGKTIREEDLPGALKPS